MSFQIVTRFAPSPTGYLHVGGARTALFNWLLARHSGGQFLLRIEDTDLARSSEQAVKQLLDDLRWLGLNWDNVELVFQSKRLEAYNGIIEQLMSQGMAYKAYETPEELEGQRRIAERAKRAYIYKRPKLTDEQIRKYESEGRPAVVRFAMPVREFRFHDVVLGKEIVLGASQVQDFVIRKTDGMPTYHFAVVVDDAAMGISHILRGQEHLLNTVNHIALQEALGYARPTYGHLPVILNTDGSKMGKRDRDKKIRHRANVWLKNTKRSAAELAAAAALETGRIEGWLADDGRQLEAAEQQKLMPVVGLEAGDLPEILVHDFRASGYLPDVLLNFLALLGWSPGGDRERMSVGEMVQLFSLDRVGQANAKFNRDKLLAFNTEACAAAGATQLVPAMRDFLSVNADSPLGSADAAALEKVIAMNVGMRTLREAEQKSRFLFLADENIEYQADAVEKILLKNDKQGLNVLGRMRQVLDETLDWTAACVEAAVKGYCASASLALGKVAQPIRVAVSGTSISPPIFASLEFLGKERTLRRIDNCLRFATSQ
ncbi:MAG: glutamate--tRNA ligase [Tepidisphaeraceae bacterium]|jgi:glutamyl-tRNA synthetase